MEWVKNTTNQSLFNKYTNNNDINHIEFSGGKWEDVTNLNNMDSFKKTLGEFKKNRLEEKISAKIDYSPRRKRQLSEHDGDYDHDKRWEIKSFNNSKKEMLLIDVNVDMSINCSMSADAINSYGALVWSIIQLVESIGIQANVNIINDCSSVSDDIDSKITLNIKKAGQYISPVALATCFQAVFFRRAIFSAMILCCENFKSNAYSSLGRPRVQRTDKYIWFKDGAIYTRAGGAFNAKEVEEAILKLVQKGK